jgi:DNA-binding NarL/FixJ family response regulator
MGQTVDELNRPTVLVADDHGLMLNTVVRLLSTEFNVVAALLDGRAAVAAVLRHAPDVVVLDIAMPGLSGIAAARGLKQGGSHAHFVFITMHHDPDYVRESLALGTVAFVVKDRLASDLLVAVHEVLAGRSFVAPFVAR